MLAAGVLLDEPDVLLLEVLVDEAPDDPDDESDDEDDEEDDVLLLASRESVR